MGRSGAKRRCEVGFLWNGICLERSDKVGTWFEGILKGLGNTHTLWK